MTKYGIGYTIFKFDDRTKTAVDMVKAKPGNMRNEIEKLEKRIRKLNKNRGIELNIWMFFFGFTFRVFLSLLYG